MNDEELARSNVIKRSFSTVMRAVENDDEDNDDLIVEGYALKFDEETIIGSSCWGFKESISKDAMKTAEMDDVVFNMNHDNSKICARTLNGSLELSVDDIGLKTRAKLARTTGGKDLYEMIRSGLITTMSFCAYVKKSKWTESADEELDKREIVEFGRFFDVSAVTFAAYPQTEISAARSTDHVEEDVKKHFEEKAYRMQIKELDKLMEDVYE